MILVRQHGESGPPALLGEWLDARGIAYVVSDSRTNHTPDVREFEAVASLGCRYSPVDADVPQVAAEIALITRAVEHDVPVLGLCYGGQVLAHVLGGTIEAAPTPEFGWREIETDEPDAVPSGPWLLWHYQRFTVPPGATAIARTRDATQAFRHGRHLGLQFHPESTTDIVEGWARKDVEKLKTVGVTDGLALIEAPAEQQDAARQAAFRLFDAFRGESA
ncbi:type 1 glutamine amidotransferase [Solirubrobacter ginsenosidimutans]|uniref:Type 1 glutamine amidotransferase n=1 Tax=Solirubrobacter ginsenosidimutans TaxID=490573 RepID=A0A9X3S2A8_9ACTN|nr:type 1 glutamine amidotransferase [Solirubrobacter ginsenosidimutans]MDA0160996.1 type 1 glutamine amidotransferase [Solirubrobacter ginsenosidimutans]